MGCSAAAGVATAMVAAPNETANIADRIRFFNILLLRKIGDWSSPHGVQIMDGSLAALFPREQAPPKTQEFGRRETVATAVTLKRVRLRYCSVGQGREAPTRVYVSSEAARPS